MRGLALFVFIVTVSLGIIAVVATSPKITSPTPQKSQNSSPQNQKPKNPLLKKLQVGNTFVWVKVAKTDEEKRQGLSGVKSMAEDEGLLFVYDKPAIWPFWMKDMNFPLDFIWIREGQVVDLSEKVPVLEENGEITRVRPNQSVDQILEVNSGFVEKNKIKIGDKVEMKNE